MLQAGDEFGRTQRGTNNAYCQDNEISWLDWDLDETKRQLLDFTRGLIALRHAHPALRRRKFFQGRPIHGSEIHDITWLRPDGSEMTEAEWSAGWTRSMAMRLGGEALGELDEDGKQVEDDNLLLIFNAHHDPIEFTLPTAGAGAGWEPVIDTRSASPPENTDPIEGGGSYSVAPRSMALLREVERRKERRS